MKEVILITDRYSPESVATLRKEIPVEIIQQPHRPDPNILAKATAILIRSRTKIDGEFLTVAKNLKVIVTATSGYDHINLQLTKNKNITVMHTPDANTESAAELTLLLVLGALRHLSASTRLLKDGYWKDVLHSGHELRGKTVGLIGLGRVGSRVAELLKAFGAHVLAHDPYQKDEIFKNLSLERLGLTEVLTQAEILSLHVPLTDETRHMIRADTIELMHEGALLINTSRGPVVDERALVAALESKQLLGAGLDVFENEPLARESRLRKMPQVLLTPHIGAHTDEAYLRASNMAVLKLIKFLKVSESSDNLPLQ